MTNKIFGNDTLAKLVLHWFSHWLYCKWLGKLDVQYKQPGYLWVANLQHILERYIIDEYSLFTKHDLSQVSQNTVSLLMSEKTCSLKIFENCALQSIVTNVGHSSRIKLLASLLKQCNSYGLTAGLMFIPSLTLITLYVLYILENILRNKLPGILKNNFLVLSTKFLKSSPFHVKIEHVQTS